VIGRAPKQKAADTLADLPVIPAFRHELGLKIRFHVPHVYALGPRIIEIEEGEEALYPRATEWRVVPRAHDDTRQKGPGERHPQERFIPEPHIRQGVKADVVICPRLRKHGPSKNWPHWHMLAELPGVFAAGAADSSYDLDVPRAWDYARCLDASIEAIRSARLVIATDAGLAHLAVLCGTPLLLLNYRGLVSPGPVVSAEGRVIQPAYWPVRWEHYYVAANHTGAHIEMIDGWEHQEAVLCRATELLGA
jgi:hypothetical protein